MIRNIRFTIGRKIYAIIALSFGGLLALTWFTTGEMNAGLKAQKALELNHLAELALSIVKEEHKAAQQGTISTEEAQKRAAARIAVLRYGAGDYFTINNYDGRMVMHATAPQLNGKDVSGLKDPAGTLVTKAFTEAARKGGDVVYFLWAKPGSDKPQPKASWVTGFEPWGWAIGTGVYIDDLDAQTWRATRNALLVAGLVLIVLGAVSIVIAGGISRAMAGMTRAMHALAEGRLDVVLPGLGRRDEIGDVAAAVESFKVKAVEKARHEAEEREARTLADADERRRVDEREATHRRAAEERAAAERKAAMHALAEQFQSAVGHIVQTVSSAATELEAAAGTLSQTADVTQRLSGSVAAASEQASANVQSVAGATEEMTASVAEISRQVHESSQIAGEAVKQAEKTDSRISDLSQAAGRIGDVVKLITAIAEQTNLLALNATIEAARAGEAGKGFAVVASEVKALAAQTAKATDEIGTQIAGMQQATQESVAAIKEIGSTIARIADISGSVAAAVEQQGAATHEIASNVQQAARGTTQVASNIADVNRGAGETGTASGQVLTSARSLAQESAMLEREVAKFLDTVRAA